MQDNIFAAVDRWKRMGQHLLPALPAARRAELLATLPSSMVDDISCLYSLCNGMPDGDNDNNMFCLWPLEVSVEQSSSWPQGTFALADGFINSHTYFLRADRKSGYEFCATYGVGTTPFVLAPSLDWALHLLMQSPEALLLPA